MKANNNPVSVMEPLEDSDSDRELQIAFAKGLLKPGLVKEVAEERIEFKHINDVQGLNEKLKKFKLNLPWIQKLDFVTDPAPLAPELATQMESQKKLVDSSKNSASGNSLYDDFTREMTFYRLGQAAVLECLPRLRKLGFPTRRPDDYFAEMTKPDEHMHKIRKKLKVQENALMAKEKAKKLRELKKFGKKVQIERTLEKQQEKRKILDEIKKYRKGKLDSLDFLDDKDSKKETKTDEHGMPVRKKNKKKAVTKREHKDKKFGGVTGKKKGWKRNKKGDLDATAKSGSRNRFKSSAKSMNKRSGKNTRDKKKFNNKNKRK